MSVAYAEIETPPIGLAELLDALATEMSYLGGLAKRGQLVAIRLLIFEQYECEQTLNDMRGLDVLAQTLDGLSALLGCLATKTPISWNVEASPAAKSLLLSAVITKLTAVLSAKDYAADPSASGMNRPGFVGGSNS